MSEQKESELKKRWTGEMEKLRARFNTPQVHEVESFKVEISQVIRREVQTVSGNALRSLTQNRVPEQDLTRAIEEAYDHSSDLWQREPSVRPRLLDSYSIMNKRLKILLDARQQERWADVHDRIQSLIFRVLTTIGIASVIFLTALLSHCTGVPLPMTRLPL